MQFLQSFHSIYPRMALSYSLQVRCVLNPILDEFIRDLMKSSLLFGFSRATGKGRQGKCIHAEMALLREIRKRSPEIIRTGGKGLFIVIVSLPCGGGSAKPCKECLTVLMKVLPFIKVISFRHGELEQKASPLSAFKDAVSTRGTKERCKHGCSCSHSH